jgi:DNA-binding transcriptional regulator YdaS (Cro superfamily)
MTSLVTEHAALERAILKAGGQCALGRICKRKQPTVWAWLHERKRVPAEHVLKIESATGVSRHDLRPDLYPREDVAA